MTERQQKECVCVRNPHRLVGFLVARVLEEHVGGARLGLRVDDGLPQRAGLDGALDAPLLLVALVQRVELF